ncbi:MAG: TatD family hydrolase [Bacteroidia bacterium]|jgi:TatD DNase family protein|nr:TatD family hydrolase [Bacteroidia bacterium]
MEAFYTDAHTHFRYPAQHNVRFVRNAYLHKNAGTLPYSVCCGLHPWKVTEQWTHHIELLKTLALLPNVAAIGECGLDYARQVSRELQQQAFEAHVQLANTVRKPLVLHIVQALHELPRFLRSARVTAVLHGYSGNEQQTNQLLHLNVMFSVGTRLLHKPEKLKNVVQHIPPHLLLLETDTQPAHFHELYLRTAQLLGMSEDALRMQVFSNFARTFFADEST